MPTNEKARHAETIIRNHTVWSMASGAIPIALADLAAVSAVQLDMIRQLCEVYDVDFSATRGKAMVTSITSAAIARAGAASVVKLVPIAGSLIGSVTGGVLAGASSYGLGQAFKTHLETGGTFLDLYAERLKAIYREQFEKGKEVVKEWQSSQEGADGTERKGRFRFEDIVRRKRPAGPAQGKRESNDSAGSANPMEATPTEAAAPDVGVPVQPSGAGALGQKLEELASLRDRGIISADDYERTKARLLGQV